MIYFLRWLVYRCNPRCIVIRAECWAQRRQLPLEVCSPLNTCSSVNHIIAYPSLGTGNNLRTQQMLFASWFDFLDLSFSVLAYGNLSFCFSLLDVASGLPEFPRDNRLHGDWPGVLSEDKVCWHLSRKIEDSFSNYLVRALTHMSLVLHISFISSSFSISNSK